MPAPKPKESKGCILLFKNIPRTLKDAWKAFCSARGLSMTQELITHMKECLEKDRQFGKVELNKTWRKRREKENPVSDSRGEERRHSKRNT